MKTNPFSCQYVEENSKSSPLHFLLSPLISSVPSPIHSSPTLTPLPSPTLLFFLFTLREIRVIVVFGLARTIAHVTAVVTRYLELYFGLFIAYLQPAHAELYNSLADSSSRHTSAIRSLTRSHTHSRPSPL